MCVPPGRTGDRTYPVPRRSFPRSARVRKRFPMRSTPENWEDERPVSLGASGRRDMKSQIFCSAWSFMRGKFDLAIWVPFEFSASVSPEISVPFFADSFGVSLLSCCSVDRVILDPKRTGPTSAGHLVSWSLGGCVTDRRRVRWLLAAMALAIAVAADPAAAEVVSIPFQCKVERARVALQPGPERTYEGRGFHRQQPYL